MTKQELEPILRKEFATTVKAMNAFPNEKLTYAPHERSADARGLMNKFVFEMWLIDCHVFGRPLDRSAFAAYKPENMSRLVSDFQNELSNFFTKLKSASEPDLDKTVEFAGKTFIARDFILMMLFDQIHHRGQLSVYVRLAGGKVPSIYGPSADDPKTNL